MNKESLVLSSQRKQKVSKVDYSSKAIEDFFLRPAVKKAITLLLYLADIKVLKDALAHLGPYQTLMSVWGFDPGG